MKQREKNVLQREFYQSVDPDYLIHDKNIPYARHLVGKLLTELPDPERLSILEIGAGQGRFTLELARHVRSVTATDLSRNQIEILKQKIQIPNSQIPINSQNQRKKSKQTTSDTLSPRDFGIECLVQDLLKPPPRGLKGKRFDAIVGFFMLHHIERRFYPAVLANILPLLKPNGKLVFIEPNCLYPFHLVEMLIEPDMHWEVEKQIYSNYLGTFINACTSAGLKRKTVTRFGFFPPPFINRMPFITKIEPAIENVPFVHQFLTPFVILSFERTQS